MNIEKRKINLLQNTYSHVNEINTKDFLEIFKKEVTKTLNVINNFVYLELDKLADGDFYHLICTLYNISLDEADYLEIISKRNNKKYNRFIKINTYMVYSTIDIEENNKDFSWWEQLYQITYTVALEENCNLENYAYLSKKKIQKLLDKQSIVIVNRKDMTLYEKPDFNKEKLEEYPIMNLSISDIYFEKDKYVHKGKNFPIVISMLRKTFTKKKILKDMEEYLLELQKDLDIILSQRNNTYPYNEIAKLCNDWFETSEEKDNYTKLLKKLILN